MADEEKKLLMKVSGAQIETAVTQAAGALQKSGGAMTGPITLYANPTEDMQPASKQYVDNSTPKDVVMVTEQALSEDQKSQGRKNIGAASQADFDSICERAENIIDITEDNYYDFSSQTDGLIVFNDDGFEFTRGSSANYTFAFLFPTETGKAYDLAFSFESGAMLYGRIAANGDYPNPPTYMPSTGIVTFDTETGSHKYTFTATKAEMMLCFGVLYNSPMFKISGVSCVPAGASPVPKIKETAMPESFGEKIIGERITFVHDASDFIETSTVIRSDGVRVAKTRRPSTGYLELKGCTSISFGLNQYRESAAEVYNIISFYDADKAYISGLPSPANGYTESTVNVPENAAYAVGSWFEGLTDRPYMVGIYDESLAEKINTVRMADPLNADRAVEVVNSAMSLDEFVSAINGQWESYAALCRCVPWCFMPLRLADDNYRSFTFAEICEIINKNFRAEVTNPVFSFAENCNRINNAFKKPIYRFADAKLYTKNTDDFIANLKTAVDFSLSTGMAKVEPSVIVSDDGNTMHVYAYNHRISTVDGVNWTEPVFLTLNGHAGLVHVNVNYIDNTYYLTGCDVNTGGTFGMMTSTDGINFTYQGALFLENHEFTSGKPVLQWGNSCIVKDYGSNTYFLYVEYRTDMNSGWEIGVVTATDIFTANSNGTIGNWQNVADNPILSKLWLKLDGTNSVGAGNPDFAKGEDNRPVKVDGRYFMLVHSSHQNYTNIAGQTKVTSGSQSNIIRLSSTNLIDWEVDGLLFDNRDIPEDDDPAAAKATSGNADCCIIQFKGRTYLFYSWNINHQTTGQAEYVKYMIDDRPIREWLKIRP